MERSQACLLTVGQTEGAGGYARVGQAIGSRLQYRYDLHHFERFATGGHGHVRHLHDGRAVYYPMAGDDAYGTSTLPGIISTLKPDLILIAGDFALASSYRRILHHCSSGTPVVAYLAIEGPLATVGMHVDCSWLDYLVVFHESAAHEVMENLPPARRPQQLAIIGHGVDRQAFAPLVLRGNEPDLVASRAAARAQLFPGDGALANAFIVLNANRNIGRKRIDLTLESFARFVRGRTDDVRLYLHMGMRDRGVDVCALARRLGIGDRILTTDVGPLHPKVDDAHLRLIYNACDIGINTSDGEGWGLIAFEHAASGAAQIVPRHPTHDHLWGDAVTMVPTVIAPERPGNVFRQLVVDPNDLSHVLTTFADNRSLLTSASIRAFHRASAPSLEWDAVESRWDTVVSSLLRC